MESSAIYYRLINQYVKERCGGLHSAKLLLWSFDFEDIASLQAGGHWQEMIKEICAAGLALKHGGADALLICTNTMHKIAPEVEAHTQLPLIHIVDVVGCRVAEKNIKKIGLLATKLTMEEDFYKERLKEKYRIETSIPNDDDRKIIHGIIYEELCKGQITTEAKKHYITIMHRLIEDGAQAIVLACTEIGMLIKQEDISIPIFDTTELHAKAAVDYMLSA